MANILTSIKSIFSKKSLDSLIYFFGAQDQYPFSGDSGSNYRKMAKSGYIEGMAVYACINRIVTSMKQVDILIYENEKELDPKHEMTKLLKRPNPKQSWGSFIEELMVHLLIDGNAYLFINKVRGGAKLQEISLLRPDCVTIEGEKYLYRSKAENRTYTEEEVTHIKLYHPLDSDYGLSKIQVAMLAIDENKQGRIWNWSLMKNFGLSPGVLKAKDNLTDEQYSDFKRKWRKHNSGADNSGLPTILEGGMDYREIGLKPIDVQWLAGRKMSTVDICQIFGVPPELVGYPEFRTYNNVKEAKEQFYIDTVLPLLDFVLDEMSERIFFGIYSLVYDPDKIRALQENVDALWDRALKGKNNGLLSLNEARLILGYEIVNYGNVIYDSMGKIPIATDDNKKPSLLEEELFSGPEPDPKPPDPEPDPPAEEE